MKCPNCRADIHNSSLRCPYCGYNIQQYREATQNYSSARNDQRYDTTTNSIYTAQVSHYAENDARGYYSQEQPRKVQNRAFSFNNDYGWILFVLGVVGLGLQIINTVLVVALILQM